MDVKITPTKKDLVNDLTRNVQIDHNPKPTRERTEDLNLTTEDQKTIHHKANAETKSDDHLVDLIASLLDLIRVIIHPRQVDLIKYII